MDATPNLSLPYIMAAQSQKHVTHNEAIRALDAIVQLSVLDRGLSTPPSAPAEGARYIIAAGPTGAWSGHAGKIAAYQDGAWMFYAPQEGWIAWVADENVAVVWSGTAWIALTTGEGGGGGGEGGDGSFETLGINADANATNRLSVAADATLLSHDGDDHRLKINKAGTGDTASIVYQTGFSGRAELGLAGDDDFHFKVSGDGATWKEAIVINRATGVVSFPNTSLGGGGGSGRDTLTGARTYYVRTTGSDSNNGLSAGSAFATIQKAIDTVAGLDLSVFDVTISVGTGTYTGANRLNRLSGAGTVTIEGAGSSTIISVTGNNCFFGSGVSQWVLSDMRLTTVTSGNAIFVENAATVEAKGIDFGPVPPGGYHMRADANARITAIGNYTISGRASAHMLALWGGHITVVGRTVTLTGTPTIDTAFAQASRLGKIEANSNSYVGSASGARYLSDNNSVVFTNGGGANYFPGTASGSTGSGGIYS